MWGRPCLSPCPGGDDAVQESAWVSSWQLPIQAATAGLLIARREPFTWTFYQVAGRRNRGLGFNPGNATVYTLVHPQQEGGVSSTIQKSCLLAPVWTHELHLWSSSSDQSPASKVPEVVQAVVGQERLVHCKLVDSYHCPNTHRDRLTFEVAYGSLTIPLSREKADELRCQVRGGRRQKNHSMKLFFSR